MTLTKWSGKLSAAQILARLLAVDGAGSGLDADLLDGQHASAFQSASAILDDLAAIGAPTTDGQIIVATGAGAFAYESGATARTSLGFVDPILDKSSPGDIGTSTPGAGDFTDITITGGSQNVSIEGLGNDLLINGDTAGSDFVVEIQASDNDGTDRVGFEIDAIGAVGGGNLEGLFLGWDSANSRFALHTDIGGAATARSLAIGVDADLDAILIGTAGAVTINSLSSSAATITGGSIDGTPIGASTPSTLAATTGTFSSNVDLTSGDVRITGGDQLDLFRTSPNFNYVRWMGSGSAFASDSSDGALIAGFNVVTFGKTNGGEAVLAQLDTTALDLGSGVGLQANGTTVLTPGRAATFVSCEITGTALGLRTANNSPFASKTFAGTAVNILKVGTGDILFIGNTAIPTEVYSSADVKLIPNAGSHVQYGTHSAIGAETVTGYITIKDSGGTTRKLAVVS